MKKRNRGLTMMELVIMIAIASILMTGMTRTVQSLLEQQVQLRDTLVAINLARYQMAIMNNAAYPNVATTNPASATSFDDFDFTQDVTAVASSGGSSVRQVQLDVTRAGEVVFRVYTYRTNVLGGTTGFGNGA